MKKLFFPIICVNPKPATYPNIPPRIPVKTISVSISKIILLFVPPIAFINPISWLLSITEAVIKFEIPRAEANELKIQINNIKSSVLFKIVPSDSATCLLGLATLSVKTGEGKCEKVFFVCRRKLSNLVR